MEIQPKGNQSWMFFGRTDAEAEAPVLWPPDAKSQLIGKRPCCWERLRAGERDDRGWASRMASPTQWTWVWATSGKWWWTGKPGMLQPTGSQGVGHSWVTEQQRPVGAGSFVWRYQSSVSLLPWVRGGFAASGDYHPWPCWVGPASCRITWESHIQSFFSWLNL